MKLTLAEPKYLKDSITVISDLVNEARFKINSNALEMVAMDPANVAMVIFKLLASCFTEYDVKKPIDIVINLASLKQILRRAKPSDMLSLELGEDSKLTVQLRGNTIRTFSIPLIESDEKEQRVPELSFPISITTAASVLNEAIEDVDIVAESVSLVADDKKLSVIAEGDMSKAHIEIKADDVTKIDAKEMDKIKAKYSIEYLKKMMGGSKIADNVTIQFNKDYPLKIEYKVVDRAMLAFILAPRVEND